MPSDEQPGYAGDVAEAIGKPVTPGSRRDAGTAVKAGEMELLGTQLHALCQPLTAIQCRLEIGLMLGTLDGYEESVTDSLQQCERLTHVVRQMRQVVGRALERA